MRVFLFALALACCAGIGHGQITTPNDAREVGLESLRIALQNDGGIKTYLPPDIGDYVRDQNAAIQLGKALFHDSQAGSDGVQSCFSCHSHAGADQRAKNELDPALLRVKDQTQGDVIGFYNAAKDPDEAFELGGPNHQLQADDFPFTRTPEHLIILPDGTVEPDVANGNRNDISSSQGVFYTYYYDTISGYPYDRGMPLRDPVFNVNGINIRRSEQRNAPQVFNAILNFTNFWDGRANPEFNGATVSGPQDLSARIFKIVDGQLVAVQIALKNGSLASQAMAPPVSFFEMSYGNGVDNFRTFPEIGRKLLDPRLTPLGRQLVDRTDSVLGPLSNYPCKGLKGVTYKSLIQKAFNPKYWNSTQLVEFDNPALMPMPSNHGFIMNGPAKIITPGRGGTGPGTGNQFTQMEANFSLFFGLSIMLYESKLIMDQTPFDQWMETGRFNKGFGSHELAGLNLFVGKGLCINCHSGPEFTSASIRSVREDSAYDIMDISGSPGIAPYDTGFFNTAVVPTADDLARGGADPFGRPLSFARQYAFQLFGIMDIPFPLQPLPDPLVDEDGNPVTPREAFQRLAIDGAFKTATTRGTLLTGPFFHNGGEATLHQVVRAYNHGQNFRNFNSHDVDENITDLGLTAQEINDLVAFLISQTDPRARIQAAPFDHPQAYIPNGHPGNEDCVQVDYNHQAKDQYLMVPATGAAGDPLHPLQTFLNLNPYDDNPLGNVDAYIYKASQWGAYRVPAPGVLANDTSAIGKPLSAYLTQNVSHGTLTLNRDGSFNYRPNASFTGTDRFLYVAATSTFDSNPTTVTITVSR